MKPMRSCAIWVLLSLTTAGGSLGLALPVDPGRQESTAPDNTKINKRDRHDNAVTAEKQKGNASDVEMARQIRRAVVADKSLSAYAHNIKIVVHNGVVTLKGPVNSDEEKKTLEAKASELTGRGKVINQIEVKTKQ